MTDRHILGLVEVASRLLFVGTLGALTVAACGGSGTPGTDMTGSGGAADGSGTGGNVSGTGGAGNGSGGAASGTGGASNPTGGRNNAGGEGGFGGGNGASCPAAMPDAEESCEGGFPPLSCTYGGQVCECEGFGPNATWDCGEASSTECPAEEPTDGEDCDLDGESCDYGETTCTCPGFGQNPSWNCDAAVICPAEAPTAGDECEGTGMCDYGGDTCVCGGQGEWFCF